LFALMAWTWRQFGGPGHPAGARSRLLTVLVGDGVTIASEIVALARARIGCQKEIKVEMNDAPSLSRMD
jgi:hypothetical protein